MQFLHFDLSDNDEGVTTLEALASTAAAQHAAVMAEVRPPAYQGIGVRAWRHPKRPCRYHPACDACGAWRKRYTHSSAPSSPWAMK